VRVAMERTVDVSSCVRDHLDLADLEFRPLRVTRARRLTAQESQMIGAGRPL
jgi:hypothetical protein